LLVDTKKQRCPRTTKLSSYLNFDTNLNIGTRTLIPKKRTLIPTEIGNQFINYVYLVAVKHNYLFFRGKMEEDCPLFCYRGVRNDDFAGWYSAVSSSTECKDFCFWKQPGEYYEGKLSYTTADPHQFTQSPNGATWGCLVDATGKEATWKDAFDLYEDFSMYNETFPYLRCARGPGEKLKSTMQDLSRSKACWWTILLFALIINMVQVIMVLRKRRHVAYSEILPYSESQDDEKEGAWKNVNSARAPVPRKDDDDSVAAQIESATPSYSESLIGEAGGVNVTSTKAPHKDVDDSAAAVIESATTSSSVPHVDGTGGANVTSSRAPVPPKDVDDSAAAVIESATTSSAVPHVDGTGGANVTSTTAPVPPKDDYVNAAAVIESATTSSPEPHVDGSTGFGEPTIVVGNEADVKESFVDEINPSSVISFSGSEGSGIGAPHIGSGRRGLNHMDVMSPPRVSRKMGNHDGGHRDSDDREIDNSPNHDIQDGGDDRPENDADSTLESDDIAIVNHARRKCVKKFIKRGLIVVLNLVTLFLIFVSTVSLLELQSGVDLPFALQKMTPACVDTESLCPGGHSPINRESVYPIEESFSYIIGSDAQLDWYDGESASIGSRAYPPPCSSSDSCHSCTKKVGTYTNQQMKKSFEKLINGSATDINQPVPKTLIMNGDLTQYFHRHEFKRYASFYHSIDGLEQYFPSLGNHDYDQGSATYDGDEWFGPHNCNGQHAVAYFRGAFCGKIPNFDAKQRVTRYDPASMAYSWEQGFYHFVNVHYYPTYENAALGIKSSLEWVEQDLILANAKNLTNVLFVHSVDGIPQPMEKILLENNVAVIFAAHIHRCFGKYCDIPRALNTQQAADYLSKTENDTIEEAAHCFPASAALCGTRADGNGMFYLRDKADEMALPSRKLFSKIPDQSSSCPSAKFATYVNITDNTALCTGQPRTGEFPFNGEHERKIPVFWSGSASYETFLLSSFHKDRIVVNMMTATEGNEGRRYVDTHPVPNAVYPSHSMSTLEEVIINL